MTDLMAEDAATPKEDWIAVVAAIQARRRELKMSLAKLVRETGMSESTIRYLSETGPHHKVGLVAMSAVLGWRHDYLTNILRGELHKNVHIRRPVTLLVEEVVKAQLDPVKTEVAGLKEVVQGLVQGLK
jgi:hypothetical protein